MKFKTVKYNKNGLSRADNTAHSKTVLPKKDLNKSNVKITSKDHYLKVSKKK